MQTTAQFSPNRKYRYLLIRTWDEKLPNLGLIMINPSNADEETDDPTIRRCIALAKNLGYGSIWVGNLFAYVCSQPNNMFALQRNEGVDVVGPDNLVYLEHLFENVDACICAWGNNGNKGIEAKDEIAFLSRRNKVPLYAFQLTKTGEPQHPLYLPNNTDVSSFTLKTQKTL